MRYLSNYILKVDARVDIEVAGETVRSNVPHSEILSPGFCFQPARDTVWLVTNFYMSKPNEVKTDKIRSLALEFEHCLGLWGQLTGLENPLFTGLRELIVLTDCDV
jgi:hypothetical protein